MGISFGAAALVLAVLAAIGQYRLAGAYVRQFELSDWTPVNGELRLVVTAKEHGKGKAPRTIVMLRQSDGTLEQVEVDVTEDPDLGDITLAVAATAGEFDGEVRIS